jgi:hypothetical protein
MEESSRRQQQAAVDRCVQRRVVSVSDLVKRRGQIHAAMRWSWVAVLECGHTVRAALTNTKAAKGMAIACVACGPAKP